MNTRSSDRWQSVSGAARGAYDAPMETTSVKRARGIALGFLAAALAVGCAKEGPVDREAKPPVPAKPAAPDYAKLLAALPAPAAWKLDADRAGKLAALTLACADKEYPNKTSDVADGDATVRFPRVMHPAFFGCFDWHSAVHGHWALVRLMKTVGFSEKAKARAVLDAHLTPERIAGELAYFQEPRNKTFERPYGFGWFLRLAVELRTWDDPDAKRWAAAIAPLEQQIAAALASYLDALSVPVRAGTHDSTAFAMAHAWDYAVAVGDEKLEEALGRRARDFFLADTECPTAFEPSGEDFISPCLAEADLMRRVLPKNELARWLDRFFGPLDAPAFAPLRTPPIVKDRADPRIGHLIGLSLERSAAFRGIASALPEADPRRAVFERLAAIHRDDGLAKMEGSGYGGEHWLASFAIYLLTDAGGRAAELTRPRAGLSSPI
jgi:hypothetical protein